MNRSEGNVFITLVQLIYAYTKTTTIWQREKKNNVTFKPFRMALSLLLHNKYYNSKCMEPHMLAYSKSLLNPLQSYNTYECVQHRISQTSVTYAESLTPSSSSPFAIKLIPVFCVKSMNRFKFKIAFCHIVTHGAFKR